LVPSRTAGTTGLHDQGDPTLVSIPGWLVGVTGLLDWADRALRRYAKPDRVTLSQLKRLFRSASDTVLVQLAAEINVDPERFQLDTVLRLSHFFGQVLTEGGDGLHAGSEVLNYNHDVLKKKFSYYSRNPDEADIDGYVRNAAGKIEQRANIESIGNKIYGGRADLGNGPISGGDGYRYRGRGLIQVTGRANYRAVTNQYKSIFSSAEDFELNPELVLQFPYDVRTAICFWVMNRCAMHADKGASADTVDSITDIVNINTDTRALRKKNFKKAYDVFND
jgi:predicted chitinase